MPLILFAYEFGGGLGHLNRLVSVAKALKREAQFVFALPRPQIGLATLAQTFGGQARVVSGAFWPGPSSLVQARKVPTETLADVFMLFGFDRAELLVKATATWRRIVDTIRPDLIVVDFAPSLRLAMAHSIPTVVVGNGYTVPPPGMPLPPLRPWRHVVPARSRMHEAGLLEAVNAFRARANGPAIDFFSDLFQGEHTNVCSFPEFDPYRRYRSQPQIPPFNIPDIRPGPPIADRRDYGIFAYIPSNHPALGTVIEALGSISEPSELYVGDRIPNDLRNRTPSSMRLRSEPVDYNAILPRAKLLLHHGGLGTAYAGLMAGVPQIMLPLSLEHLITARQTEKLGISLTLPAPQADGDPARIRGALERVLTDSAIHSAAARTARNFEQRAQGNGAHVVAGACESMLLESAHSTARAPKNVVQEDA